MKKRIYNIIYNSINLKIFRYSIDRKIQIFVKNIGFVSLGTLGGAIFFFITNITAGRLLGPTEYGKYSLITSLGQIFIIPMMFGISTASIKYISSSKNLQKKKNFAQNTISLSIILTFLTTIVFLIFNSQISKLFKINNHIFIFTLIYSIFLSFKYIFEAITKGFHQFKLLSFLEFINSFSIFIYFFINIFLFKKYNFQSLLISVIIGSLIYIIVFLNKNFQNIPPIKVNIKTVKTILSYGKYATLGAISGIAISNIDKLVLNKYMSFADIGTYSIYLGASSLIGNYILQIFLQVFFPTVSSLKNKTQVTKKIYYLIILTIIPLFLINFCSTLFTLFLMGGKYEINIIYILLFSFLGMLTISSNTLWWLINSYGKQGIRYTSSMGILIGTFNIILMKYLVTQSGIFGIIFTLIITNVLMIIAAVLHLNQDPTNKSQLFNKYKSSSK